MCVFFIPPLVITSTPNIYNKYIWSVEQIIKYILTLREVDILNEKIKLRKASKRKSSETVSSVCVVRWTERNTYNNNKDEYDEVKGLSVRHIYTYTPLYNTCKV